MALKSACKIPATPYLQAPVPERPFTSGLQRRVCQLVFYPGFIHTNWCMLWLWSTHMVVHRVAYIPVVRGQPPTCQGLFVGNGKPEGSQASPIPEPTTKSVSFVKAPPKWLRSSVWFPLKKATKQVPTPIEQVPTPTKQVPTKTLGPRKSSLQII